MELNQIVKRIRSFDLEREVLKTVSLNDKKALNLNRDDQLFGSGSDSLGDALTPDYASFTIDQKRFLGQPTDRVTLRDTEAFHNSFFMDASSFPVRIDATDSKTSELKQKYGEDIFGLDQDSQSEFNAQILPDLQDVYKKSVGVL